MARVYVSSTSGDLRDYRKAVNEVLRDLGHDDIAMEHYVSEDRPPLARCLEDVASCHLYILIIAWRYGSIPPGMDASYTHLEFRQAQASEIPCLAFLLDPDIAWPPSNVDDPRDRVTAFRDEVRNGRLTSSFTSVDHLRSLVIRSVRRWEDRTTASDAGLPPAGGSAEQILRTVPSLVPDFTGREPEIETAWAALRGVGDSPAPAIVAISGPPSVGKSQLAVRIARDSRVTELFPDGQLYLNLRGQEARTIEPDLALRLLLRDLGVPMENQPPDREDRQQLFRSYFEGQRMLLILDNAQAEHQVEPLLPAAGSSGVLLTSRRRIQLPGATAIRLAPLELADGLEFLGKLVGPQLIEADPEAARLVVERCGGFPLAIRMAGSLAARRQMALATLANRLADDRSEILDSSSDDTGRGIGASVRSSFALSYQYAPPEARRLLLQLSLFDLGSFGIGFAAALAGNSIESAEHMLWQLSDEHLLEPLGDDLFRLHDLLREFAAENSSTERDAVIARGIEWYATTASRMNELLHPVTRRERARDRARENGAELDETEHALEQLALDWFTSEILNITTIARMAAGRHDHGMLVRLALSLRAFLELRGTSGALAQMQEQALAASRQQGDRAAEAQILNNLALLRHRQGRDEDALELLDEATAISRDLGDGQIEGHSLAHLGAVQSGLHLWSEARDSFSAALDIGRQRGDRFLEGRALLGLGFVSQFQGRWDEAHRHYEQALEIKRDLGDRHGEQITLSGLSNIHAARGRWDASFQLSEQVRAESHETGDLPATGIALGNLGLLYSSQGNWPQAIEHSEQALAVWQQLGDRRGEAMAHINLGNVYAGQGLQQEAAGQYHQALAIAREINDRGNQAEALNNLGLISARPGNWDEAIAYIREAQDLWTMLRVAFGQGKTLMNLGLIYANQGNWDEAEAHYRQALEQFRKAGVHQGEGLCLMNQGNLFVHQERWQEAMDCYERARAIWTEMSNELAEGQTVWNMGLLYEKQGDIDEAKRHYDEALSYIDPELPLYRQMQAFRDLLGIRSGVSRIRRGIARLFREAQQ